MDWDKFFEEQKIHAAEMSRKQARTYCLRYKQEGAINALAEAWTADKIENLKKFCDAARQVKGIKKVNVSFANGSTFYVNPTKSYMSGFRFSDHKNSFGKFRSIDSPTLVSDIKNVLPD